MKRIYLLIFLILLCTNYIEASPYDAKVSTAQWIPVVVLDSSESGQASVSYSSIVFKYMKEGDTAWTTQALNADNCTTPASWDWCEIGDGDYLVYVPTTAVNTKGNFKYKATGTGYKEYRGWLKVKTETSDEESDTLAAIELDTGTDGVIVNLDNATGTLSDAQIDNITVTAGTVSDKSGYSLTQSFPTNFADLAITVTTGKVTVGTNDDKTGYSVTGLTASNLDVAVSTLATQTSVDTIDGNVDLILADTGTDGVVVASGSKTGYSLAPIATGTEGAGTSTTTKLYTSLASDRTHVGKCAQFEIDGSNNTETRKINSRGNDGNDYFEITRSGTAPYAGGAVNIYTDGCN